MGKTLKMTHRSILSAVAFGCVVATLTAQKVSLPEPIEWTWEARPTLHVESLPNVLLLGDSITRAYYPEVNKDLSGIANVYLLATSASVGDPRLVRQIADFGALERVRFEVVHFNNGMHGWGYTESQYRGGFASFLHAVQEIPGNPRLVWATTTPVQRDESDGPSNARIDARNRIAASFVNAEKIVIDDQHTLMAAHQDQHQDNVHYQEAGAALMGDQAASIIREQLAQSR